MILELLSQPPTSLLVLAGIVIASVAAALVVYYVIHRGEDEDVLRTCNEIADRLRSGEIEEVRISLNFATGCGKNPRHMRSALVIFTGKLRGSKRPFGWQMMYERGLIQGDEDAPAPVKKLFVRVATCDGALAVHCARYLESNYHKLRLHLDPDAQKAGLVQLRA